MARGARKESPLLTPEEALQAVIRNAPVSISVTDAGGTLLFAAGRGLELLGVESSSVVGKKAAESFKEEGRIPELMARVLKGETVNDLLDVRGRVVEVWMSPLRDADGTPTAVISIATDVTDREGLNRKLKETDRILSLAEEAAGFGIWYSDPSQEGRLTWSEGEYRIFGIAKEAFDGRVETFFGLVHPDDLERVRAASRDALAGKSRYDVEHRIVRPDGQVRWVHQEAEVSFGPDGAPLRMVGMTQDITDRKDIEAARQESEKRYRATYDAAPIAIGIHQDGRYVYANRAFAALLGVEGPERIVGVEALSIVHPEDREIVRHRIDEQLETGASAPPLEERFVRKDGTYAYVEVVGARVTVDGRQASLVFAHDISGRKRLERDIAESEEKFRTIFELADDAIFLADAVTGRIVDCNRKAELLIGRERAEIIGMRQTELHPPGLGDRYAGYFRDYIATGKVVPEQMYAYRKDGTEVPIKISASLLRFGGRAYVAGTFRDVTTELQAADVMRKRNLELEQFVKLTTGRELRMLELKKENEALRKRLEGKKGG